MLSRTRAAELLHDTADLIDKERHKDYGEPEESFSDIASFWTKYLGIPISSFDVGMMMILMKVARGGRGRFKRDNLVDICGYAALVGSDDKFYNNGE